MPFSLTICLIEQGSWQHPRKPHILHPHGWYPSPLCQVQQYVRQQKYLQLSGQHQDPWSLWHHDLHETVLKTKSQRWNVSTVMHTLNSIMPLLNLSCMTLSLLASIEDIRFALLATLEAVAKDGFRKSTMSQPLGHSEVLLCALVAGKRGNSNHMN